VLVAKVVLVKLVSVPVFVSLELVAVVLIPVVVTVLLLTLV
jgi:hypothetical protein